MANKRWLGGAAAVSQISTLTVGGTPAAGQIYTVIIGYRSLSYTAVASDSNASIASALQALLSASTDGEFLEVTWSVNDAVVSGVANTAGVPFTVTGSATGTGTLTVATPTVNSGPNDVSVAANWDNATLPVAGDNVTIGYSGVDLLWNLQTFAGVAFNSLTISSTFQSGNDGNGTIGLPQTNSNGTESFQEYRQQFFQSGAVACTVGNGTGQGSGRLKLDFGTSQVNIIVHGTGAALDDPLPALLVKGTNASNVVSVNSGSLGLALFSEDSATLATLNVGSSSAGAPTVEGGVGCTIAALNMQDGTVLLETAPATVNKTGGSLTVMEGDVTTWNDRGGSSAYLGTGTISTLTASSVVDFSQDPRNRTVTNATFNAGGGFNDPQRTVSWTNPFTIAGNLASVSMDWGQNLQVALTKL